MEIDYKCNVLIMGKTGTGKSSLLNYLCGTDIAKTGTGKPVTGEGIYEYKASVNGQDIRIFDSWGIEAGKVDKWNALLDQKLQEHGVKKNPSEWFHSVIYCIQAGGCRVEDIDIEIIRKFIKEGYVLTIVLTKADQVSEEDEAKMKSVIRSSVKDSIPKSGNGEINIIATCAESKKTRAGETHPFGKEKLKEAILKGWKESVIERLPEHIIERLCDDVESWKGKEIAKMKDCINRSIVPSGEELRQIVEEDIKVYVTGTEEKVKRILNEAIGRCEATNATLENMLDLPNKVRDVVSLLASLSLAMVPIIGVALATIGINRTYQQKEILDYITNRSEDIKKAYNNMKDGIEEQLRKKL